MKKQEKITGKNLTNGQSKSITYSTLTQSEENALRVFAKHKPIYDLYVHTGELVNFHADVHNEIINAFKEINPHYHYNRNCPSCVCDMLRDVYNYYNSKI